MPMEGDKQREPDKNNYNTFIVSLLPNGSHIPSFLADFSPFSFSYYITTTEINPYRKNPHKIFQLKTLSIFHPAQMAMYRCFTQLFSVSNCVKSCVSFRPSTYCTTRKLSILGTYRHTSFTLYTEYAFLLT